jgi:hypothetical protein
LVVPTREKDIHYGQNSSLSRATYVTKAMIGLFGITPGCSRCPANRGSHTQECRDRIAAAMFRHEATAAAAVAAFPPVPPAAAATAAAASLPATAVSAAAAAGPAEDEDMAPVAEPELKRMRVIGGL